MRSGRWTADTDYGEGSAAQADWPQQPSWFADASGFGHVRAGLQDVGFSEADIARILGGNWQRFFAQGFVAAD